MTPRGHSSISDAADMELQILTTERENITSLLCTKSRGIKNTLRRDWRRDFYYDPDAYTITPLNEEDSSKTTLVARLNDVKEALKLSNVALADKVGVHEKSIRRWLGGECLPTEPRIPIIIEILVGLEKQAETSIDEGGDDLAENSSIGETNHRRVTSDATNAPNISPLKENIKKENNAPSAIRNNEIASKDVKRKAKKTTTTTRPLNDIPDTELPESSVRVKNAMLKAVSRVKAKNKSIDLDNPCASCPARDTKSDRFVDGEGT